MGRGFSRIERITADFEREKYALIYVLFAIRETPLDP